MGKGSDSDESAYEEMIALTLKRADERLQKFQQTLDDPDQRDENGWRPLFIAAANDRFEEIRRLVKEGADLNERCIHNGWTALMNAASSGNTRSVIELLAAGADAEVRSTEGLTALEIAAGNRRAQVIKVLVKYFEILSHR